MKKHSRLDLKKGFDRRVLDWFERQYPGPTPVQESAWPAITSGRDALLAAPTGSGKTLAAFLAVINDLFQRKNQPRASAPEGVQVLYVSPLKALSNDIRINLHEPLAGIGESFAHTGQKTAPVTATTWTGDTTQTERNHIRRTPPDILVTTPESLYNLLTSASGRKILASVRHVIADEIHALTGNKHGAHLFLSLQRLEAL